MSAVRMPGCCAATAARCSPGSTRAGRGGRRLADLLEPAPGAVREDVVAAILRELRGWVVAGDVEVGRALVAAGGTATRHSHVRSRDLRRDPAPPGWLRPELPVGVWIGPLDRGAADLAEIYAAAFPPGHADWTYTDPPPDLATELAATLAGHVVGPVLPCSRLAVTADGRPAGALIVTDAGGAPPFGGAWVAELFRRPGDDLRGTGRALLQAALAAATAARQPALSLAVSEGNPAERLYAALGLERVLSALSVIVPGPTAAASS